MLSDAQWEMVEELLPRRTGRKGRPFSDPRQMLEGILYRLLRVLADGLHLA
ncbi:transposase [Corynebacterium belfantii]